MVYLAGDNNLESYGRQDLLEIQSAGAHDAASIVAQFDAMSDRRTRRFVFDGRASLDEACVAELRETNTGDPRTLVAFVQWALEHYPADSYALVLWNHGAGWKDDDVYAPRAATGTRGQRPYRARRHLFEHASMAVAPGDRGILYDDTARDFLDNLELASAMRAIRMAIGRRLDLIGFDACLMSMVEVHYQIREHCEVAVASQEIVPGSGWPYRPILEALKREPRLTARTLGETIVAAFGADYQARTPGAPVTLSAIDVQRLPGLIPPLGELAVALAGRLSARAGSGAAEEAIFNALRGAQTFYDNDYIDLADFCRQLGEGLQDGSPEHHAADELVDLLAGTSSPVLSAHCQGRSLKRATGLSIYLPTRPVSPLYDRLDFAQDARWAEFLHRLAG
jgi:hypothetical protein